nr:LarC family nickel insertion protein [Loktanella sp. SALINAS62]
MAIRTHRSCGRPSGVSEPVSHLHLDALGGIAGDMFIAAALDAAPFLLDEAQHLASAISPDISIGLEDAKDHGLTGKRLTLTLPGQKRGPRHYPDYQALYLGAPTDAAVIDRACDILRRLAVAEAKIHGVALDQVHFHEISDWDSIVDILLSALIIERLNVRSASAGALPLGSGTVRTEHGPLPVPAPATLEILKGARFHDDSVSGERITPTGAAIFSHLCPTESPPGQVTLKAIGYGFGTKTFEKMANTLRLSLYLPAGPAVRDTVGAIVFHVDDQTPEDLAIGLTNIRAQPGVLDVQQMPSFGKKNRMASRIEVLCDPATVETVARYCFLETTTIGLRYGMESRIILPRETGLAVADDANVCTKRSTRPDGSTSTKSEMDDVARAGNERERQALRRRTEKD